MSSIEERLARDIAALSEGVVVTESELRDAREAVEERIVYRQQRDRRRVLGAAAAAAVVVGVAGVTAFQSSGNDAETAPPAAPGPSSIDRDDVFLTGDAPTSQLIDGMWREDNGGTVMLFRQDGTVRFDQRGRLFSDPLTTGTYEIDGDLITVTTTTDQQSGCTGAVFTMRASIPEGGGAMRSVAGDTSGGDTCLPVARGQVAWEQVLPTSHFLTGWGFTGVHGWQPVSNDPEVYGDWIAEGGGHVLEVAPDGSYYVADESSQVVDTGSWSRRATTLTLTSSADSAVCREGDELVLEGLETVFQGSSGIRGTVGRNSCGGAWASNVYILIPNQVS